MLLETENCTHSFLPDSPPSWYAVQTRSRHERIVYQHLLMRGCSLYLPTVTETHVWSDRRKKVEVPLFPGYVFVRIIAHNEWRVKVLRTPGVVRFVGCTAEGTPIPEDQLASVRTIVERNMPWASHPFLKVGQRVRVRGGALDGVEGIFLRRNSDDVLIISVDVIQRSMAVSIRGYDIEVC
jgi:transcriptional antiterminator NusG